MSGRDVDAIASGNAAYERNEIVRAREDFRRALAIRSQTAIANFNYGVTEVLLGDRRAGARAMRLGFSLARAHGMGASPQAGQMRVIAASLGVTLE